jgi:four helix bundle protein
MTAEILRKRTAAFAKEVDAFASPLLDKVRTRETAEQLLRSSSSVASNYRAAGRARTHTEFTSTLGTVLQEADESQYWLQHLGTCRLADPGQLAPLLGEATELVAIFTKSFATAQKNEAEHQRLRRERRGRSQRRKRRED